MQALNGQIAIVTGGSRGFGVGIARALRDAGARVWITARDEAALASRAAELKVDAFRADVTRGGDWDALFDAVLDRHGRVDLLVNNAGAGVRIAPVADQTDDQIAAAIAVNLTGAMLGCARAARQMAGQKSGTIVNIASVCARHAWPGWSVYAAAKAGLVQFTKGLYTELRPHGVRATSVIPSWGNTDFQSAAGLPIFDTAIAARCVSPQDVGRLVVDVCSLPAHLAMEEVTLWPMVQQVEPL